MGEFKTFCKSDLRTGHRVTMRCGEMGVVIFGYTKADNTTSDKIFTPNKRVTLLDYREDLKSIDRRGEDIVKVEAAIRGMSVYSFWPDSNSTDFITLWEEFEIEELPILRVKIYEAKRKLFNLMEHLKKLEK